MVDIGYFALCLALLASGYGALASALGARRGHLGLVRSGENGVLATCGLLTLAVLALWHAILSHDFQVEYVAENSNRAMSLFYLITSLWGGQNGSLLFWGWILSIYSAGLAALYRQRYRELMPYAIATLSLTSFFFCIVHLFAADPFQRLPFTPEDGRGLNPILQHPVMAIHPPMLYLGMVGMVVPFAFAIAALLTGKLDATWLRASRRWMLIPWTFLGFGLLLGGKWAYVELGWGGYWGWDPVENSSLMPWLIATAFLHSIMIQERKGMLKVWNVALAILTYALCLFGTFMTRSGIISSVHAFAQSNIGPFFGTFLVLTLVFSFGLLWLRLPLLKAENRLESFASRETAFLLNNWVLLGMLFAVFWGTVFPLVSEALTDEQITVGPPFFNQVTIPIGLVLLLLTGAGPLFAWRRTSSESLRKNFIRPVTAGALSLRGLLSLGPARPLCRAVIRAVRLRSRRAHFRVPRRSAGANAQYERALSSGVVSPLHQEPTALRRVFDPPWAGIALCWLYRQSLYPRSRSRPRPRGFGSSRRIPAYLRVAGLRRKRQSQHYRRGLGPAPRRSIPRHAAAGATLLPNF